MSTEFEFIDRYSCTGVPRPDPDTMCLGPCEGMGVVPIHMGGEDDIGFEQDPVYQELWRQAEEKSPARDGWHFVVCPDCNGTRLRSKSEGE